MANKRMFTLSVVDSDAFLDMPLSTQALYFHLNMRADDDGFIGNPKRVQRTIGASEDDMKLLIAKRFVLSFEDGVIVIKHWRMHNTISATRYHETMYIDEKKNLLLKKNGSYSFNDGLPVNDEKQIERAKRQTKDKQKTDAGLGLDIGLGLEQGLDIEQEENEMKKSKTNDKTYYPDDLLNQTFLSYIDMRKKIKKPITDRGIQLAMNKLKDLSSVNGIMDNDLAIKILEQSIFSSYLGLFPIKESSRVSTTDKVDWNSV